MPVIGTPPNAVRPVGAGAVDLGDSRVRAACQQCFTPANQANCSGFVKDVMTKLGVAAPWGPNALANEMADDIADQKGCTLLHSFAEGQAAAARGDLVVYALAKEGHGHVAVGLADPLSDGFPFASWGMLNNPSGARLFTNNRLTWAWTRADLANPEFVIGAFKVP
jgi:hypothetical protein